MNPQLVRLAQKAERLMGKRDTLKEQILNKRKSLSTLRLEQETFEKAQVVLQEVGQLTQEELTYQIGELVSLGLQSVFEDPYELVLNFMVKRNKTEAELMFLRDGEEVSPMESGGGGPVDVAAFGLRTALWCLQRPQTRNTIALDEPFRFLQLNYRGKAGQMLSELSKKLGLQFIVVTHDPNLVEAADKVFEVSKFGGISVVKEG